VPSPCPSPTPPTATSNSSKAPGEAGGGGGGHSSTLQHIGSCNPVIYDMDSQSTEVGSSEIHEAARGTKRRRSSGDSLEEDIDGASKKRRESTETSPDTSRDESGYQSDSSQHEMFHPAFRGTTCSTNTNSEILAAPANSNSSTCTATTGAVGPGQTMEIDQITSLVSIFSFGQHIMAAAAAANSGNVSAVGSGGISLTSTTNTSGSGSLPKAEAEEEEEEKKEKKSESSEDSDSESDTSSDSGHSSDDHEAAKEEEQASTTAASTKLTRSVSTPELCATSAVAAAVASNTIMASEAPPCVEVASL